MPAYALTGKLYKKRGGLGRHMKNAWQPRLFALSHTGVLSYFEGDSMDKARQSLDLATGRATLDVVPDDSSDDAPTPFKIIINHAQGQRWKLCAESEASMLEWRSTLALHCRGGEAGLGVPHKLGSPVAGVRSPSVSPSAAPHAATQRQTFLPSPLPPLKPVPVAAAASVAAARRRAPRPPSSVSFKGLSQNTPRLVKALGVVNALAVLAYRVSGSLATVLLLAALNVYVALEIVRAYEQGPVETFTLVSLMAPRGRLPLLVKRAEGVADDATAESADEAAQQMCAGATGLKRFEFDGEGGPPGTWSPCPGYSFKIRQLGYLKSKKKAQSVEAFFEVISVDLFDTEKRIGRMSDSMTFPKPKYVSPDKSIPSLWIINAQIPSECGPVRTKLDADGHGYQVVICMQLTQQTHSELEALARGEKTPRAAALRLLQKYCAVAPAEPQLEAKERGRFKVLAQIRNLEEVNISGIAKGYNGKPALINKTGKLSRVVGPDDCSMLEMDINVHAFGYMARNGLQSIYRDFQDFILSVGFCIEGRADDELPEVMLGCFDMNHVNWTMASVL